MLTDQLPMLNNIYTMGIKVPACLQDLNDVEQSLHKIHNV
jgi:hypothetical protein